MLVVTHLTGFNAGGGSPVFVGGKSATTGGSSTCTVDLTALTGGIGAAAIQGDIVIAFAGIGTAADDNVTITTADFTELADLYANDTDDTGLGIYWKIMTSSPDASVSMGNTNAGNTHVLAVQVWRGVSLVTPLDVTTTTATGTNTVLADPPSITPVTAGAVIIAGAAGGHTAGTQTFTHGALGNLVTLGGNDTKDCTVAIGSIVWTGGAYDPAAFGFSTTDGVGYSWCAATLALRPA